MRRRHAAAGTSRDRRSSCVWSKFQRSSFAFSASGMANDLKQFGAPLARQQLAAGKAGDRHEADAGRGFGNRAVGRIARDRHAGPNRAEISMTGIIPRLAFVRTCAACRGFASRRCRESDRRLWASACRRDFAGAESIRSSAAWLTSPVNTRILRDISRRRARETAQRPSESVRLRQNDFRKLLQFNGKCDFIE